MKAALLLWGWLVCAAVLAQDDPLQGLPSVSAEHQRLEQRRSEQMRALDAQEEACTHTFAQSDCDSRVQAQRRTEMSELRRQEAILHDSERQQRSQDELRSVEIKQIEHAQMDAEAEQAQRSAEQRSADLLEKQQAHARAALSPTSAPAASPAPRGLDSDAQAQNREAYLRKQEAARQRKEDLAKRLQEQGSTPPLPLPDHH